MIVYSRNNNDGGLKGGIGQEHPFLVLISEDEFREQKGQFYHSKEMLHSIGTIRYCKAEVFKECILGTLRIPEKSEKRECLLSFGFYMTDETLYLLEKTGNLKHWIEKHVGKWKELQTPDQCLLQIMEQMIEHDILYLSHLEQEMVNMEDELAQGISEDFFRTLTGYRQKLSELNAYYEQLTGLGDLMQSQDAMPLTGSMSQWERFSLRTERLQNHVHLLRENTLQLRELYQSRQDAQQNRIMCILTVVATLFLPLTFLTGWYGMNFAYMPELSWKYGYLMVIGVSVVVVLISRWIFKKKKFL